MAVDVHVETEDAALASFTASTQGLGIRAARHGSLEARCRARIEADVHSEFKATVNELAVAGHISKGLQARAPLVRLQH